MQNVEFEFLEIISSICGSTFEGNLKITFSLKSLLIRIKWILVLIKAHIRSGSWRHWTINYNVKPILSPAPKDLHYFKGWRSKFLLLTSIDVIQHILYKTNQCLIIIISISCRYISVHTLERIKFSIWRLLAVHCRLNSLYIRQMAAAPEVKHFSQCTQNFFRKRISSTVISHPLVQSI